MLPAVASRIPCWPGQPRGPASSRRAGAPLAPTCWRCLRPPATHPFSGYGAGQSGGSAISPDGWRFNVCADASRCTIDPTDGLSRWYRCARGPASRMTCPALLPPRVRFCTNPPLLILSSLCAACSPPGGTHPTPALQAASGRTLCPAAVSTSNGSSRASLFVTPPRLPALQAHVGGPSVPRRRGAALGAAARGPLVGCRHRRPDLRADSKGEPQGRGLQPVGVVGAAGRPASAEKTASGGVLRAAASQLSQLSSSLRLPPRPFCADQACCRAQLRALHVGAGQALDAGQRGADLGQRCVLGVPGNQGKGAEGEGNLVS